MKNNNISYKNASGSTSNAILSVSYPFESFKEKMDIVTKAFYESEDPISAKIEKWKFIFKNYYEKEELYKHYDLTIVEPF